MGSTKAATVVKKPTRSKDKYNKNKDKNKGAVKDTPVKNAAKDDEAKKAAAAAKKAAAAAPVQKPANDAAPVKQAKKEKKKAKKTAAPEPAPAPVPEYSSSSASDSDSAEDEPMPPAKKEQKKVAAAESSSEESSSSSDEEKEAAASSDDESSSSDDEPEPPKKVAKAAPAPAKDVEASSSEDSSSSDEEDDEEPTKNGATEAKAASSDEDDSSDESDEEESDGEESGDDEEESESESDEEDEPMPDATSKRKLDTKASSGGEPAKKSKVDESAKSSLFIGGLSYEATEDDLRDMFAECGTISSIRIPVFEDSGKARGIAFIEFEEGDAAKKGLVKDGAEIRGRWIKVQEASAKRDAQKPRGQQPKPDGCTTVFIGNLSFQADEYAISQVFEDCGEIVSVRICTDRDTGKSRGFGYVEFTSTDAVDAAMKKAGTDIAGRQVRVDFAAARTEGGGDRAPRGGRGGGRGFGRGGPRGGSRGRGQSRGRGSGVGAFSGQKTKF